MKLFLQRIEVTPLFARGVLTIDGTKVADTLEPGTGHPFPCVPEGTYPIELKVSERFNRIMPFLDEVPGRSGIEIHFGNLPRDTRGCILVGKQTTKPYLLANSRATLLPLIQKMISAKEQEQPITIEIHDPNQPEE